MKNNIRSIRYSDEIAELIDLEIGKNFSEKFENLVIRCSFEIPEKERRLQLIDEQIKSRANTLQNLSEKCRRYQDHLRRIEQKLQEFEKIMADESIPYVSYKGKP